MDVAGIVLAVVGVALVVVGAFVIISPWLTAIERRRRGDTGGVSFIPLIGPGLCAIGFAILGAPWWLYPIPCMLDFGTISIPFALVRGLRDRRSQTK